MLLRGRTINDDLGKRLSVINKPNIVFMLSEAPIHEIEYRYDWMRKASDGKAYEEHTARIKHIILH